MIQIQFRGSIYSSLSLIVPLYIALVSQHVVGDDVPNDLRGAFLSSPIGIDKGAAAFRLLDHLNIEELQQRVFDEDLSIALSSAWRRMELQAQARLLGSERGNYSATVPPELTREFIGFVEGRLNVPSPVGWAQTVSTSRMYRWGRITFAPYDPAELPHWFDAPDTQGNAMPFVEAILSVDPRYAIVRGNPDLFEGDSVNVNLPTDVVEAIRAESEREEIPESEIRLFGLATEDRAVILLPGGKPGEEEAVCFTTTAMETDPEVLWRIPLDSYWAEPYVGPGGYTEFRLRGELLVLFHYSGASIGIEGIDFTNGTRRFSFNSLLPRDSSLVEPQ